MISRERLIWKGRDLYYQDRLMISIFQEAEGLWKLRWPDGTTSMDHYNKTRTKEHAIRVSLGEINGKVEEIEWDT